MTTTSTQDVLAKIWAIKDSLSASHGHSLKGICRALYAEQQKHPGDFVNLGAATSTDKTLEKTDEFSTAVSSRRRANKHT